MRLVHQAGSRSLLQARVQGIREEEPGPAGGRFPKAQRTQRDAEERRTSELAEQYGVQGFPTIIVLNGEGRKIGELGYMPGGPSAFIAELDKLRKG